MCVFHCAGMSESRQVACCHSHHRQPGQHAQFLSCGSWLLAFTILSLVLVRSLLHNERVDMVWSGVGVCGVAHGAGLGHHISSCVCSVQQPLTTQTTHGNGMFTPTRWRNKGPRPNACHTPTGMAASRCQHVLHACHKWRQAIANTIVYGCLLLHSSSKHSAT